MSDDETDAAVAGVLAYLEAAVSWEDPPLNGVILQRAIDLIRQFDATVKAATDLSEPIKNEYIDLAAEVRRWKSLASRYWEQIEDLEAKLESYKERIDELEDDQAELLTAFDRYSRFPTKDMTMGELKAELRRQDKLLRNSTHRYYEEGHTEV